MKYLTKIISAITSGITYLFVASSVFAQNKVLFKDPAKIPTDFKAESIPQLIIQYIFYLAIFLSVVYLMFGGIKLLTSGGEKEKVSDAKKHITYSIIGLVVVLLSFFILNVVFNVIGADNPLKKGFELPTLKNVGK